MCKLEVSQSSAKSSFKSILQMKSTISKFRKPSKKIAVKCGESHFTKSLIRTLVQAALVSTRKKNFSVITSGQIFCARGSYPVKNDFFACFTYFGTQLSRQVSHKTNFAKNVFSYTSTCHFIPQTCIFDHSTQSYDILKIGHFDQQIKTLRLL